MNIVLEQVANVQAILLPQMALFAGHKQEIVMLRKYATGHRHIAHQTLYFPAQHFVGRQSEFAIQPSIVTV